MTEIEFRAWPKMSRLNRDIIISEKIDGSNAAVGIQLVTTVEYMARELLPGRNPMAVQNVAVMNEATEMVDVYEIYAQSRSRVITPADDNYGFASWVEKNALGLYHALGEGVHFGEWWGGGVNRGYGIEKGQKYFSLFNTDRHAAHAERYATLVPALRVVPVLYQGTFDGRGSSAESVSGTGAPWDRCLDYLRENGSQAAPGYMRPEGVVLYHTAAAKCFKVTLESDEVPKEQARKAKGGKQAQPKRTKEEWEAMVAERKANAEREAADKLVPYSAVMEE